jgi:hypothetical protein
VSADEVPGVWPTIRECVPAPDVAGAARPSRAAALLPRIRYQYIQKVDMFRITLHNHFPSFPSRQGQDTAPSASGVTPGTQRPADARQSAPAGVVAGKRRRGTEHYLASASQRPKTGAVKTDIVQKLQTFMMDDYNEALASLVDHICRKTPYANDAQKAERRKNVMELLDAWDARLHAVKFIRVNNAGPQKKLALTLMLKKIVWPEEVTYEQACESLRILSSSHENPVDHLTEKAQEHYNKLRETNPALPDLPEAYGRIALIALHEELESKGYRLADLADIASKSSNFGAVLLLASDIMKQPPFTSGSGGDKRFEADRALSSIAGKVRIACCRSAFQTFGAIHAHFPALQALGFLPQDILSMASHSDSAAAIKAVAAHGAELRKKGFTPAQIVMIASRSCGRRNIRIALQYCDALFEKKVSHEWIAQTLSLYASRGEIESKLHEVLMADDGALRGELMDVEPISLAEPGADEEQLARDSSPFLEDGGLSADDGVRQPALAGTSIEPFSHDAPADDETLKDLLMAHGGALQNVLITPDANDEELHRESHDGIAPIPFKRARLQESDTKVARELRAFLGGQAL